MWHFIIFILANYYIVIKNVKPYSSIECNIPVNYILLKTNNIFRPVAVYSYDCIGSIDLNLRDTYTNNVVYNTGENTGITCKNCYKIFTILNPTLSVSTRASEIYDREKKNIPSRSSISKSNKHQEDAVMKETAIVSDMNITRINGPNDKRKYGGNEIQKGIENINTWQEENKLGIQQKLSTLPVLNQTNFKFKDVIQKEILNKFRS